MIDQRLIVAQIITLLYRQSQLFGEVERCNDLVVEVLDKLKAPDQAVLIDFSKDSVSALRETISWMLSSPPEVTFDKDDLIQRIRVNCQNDQSLYEGISHSITPDLPTDKIRERFEQVKMELRDFLIKESIKDLFKEGFSKTSYQSDKIGDWRLFVSDFADKLQALNQFTTSPKKHPAIVDVVSLHCEDSVNDIFRKGIEELSLDGIIRFGWHGLNRMFGNHMGGRRGEFLVVGALQHNFKSGFSLEMLKHAALYNRPFMRDPTKKPLLLRISFENSAKLDTMYLYKSLKENETGIQVDLTAVSAVEASQYVVKCLGVNGYHIEIVHIDPTDFTYHDLFSLIEWYESEGWEIHMLNIDYLNMMSKKGCAQGPMGSEIRDLFRRVRNFIARKGIFTITPHQLSTQATELVRNGLGEDFVKEIANKNYFDGCKTIAQEVDMEIYIHIVRVGSESYLCVQRGKHRKVSITPTQDLFMVMKFEQVGGIPDDINGKDRTRKRVGAAPLAEGGQNAWYDFQNEVKMAA